MNIPLICLLFFMVSVVVLASKASGVAAEIAKAALWTSLAIIMLANLTVHVIHL